MLDYIGDQLWQRGTNHGAIVGLLDYLQCCKWPGGPAVAAINGPGGPVVASMTEPRIRHLQLSRSKTIVTAD